MNGVAEGQGMLLDVEPEQISPLPWESIEISI